jgi:hypothetical protein
MANKRAVAWSMAMRDLRNSRTRRAVVREERLGAAADLAGSHRLSSWRGRSGRRYVVGVHALDDAEVLSIVKAVIIAVGREADGTARVVDLATVGERPRRDSRAAWIGSMKAQGATELHVHRLAVTDAERRAVIDDLRPDLSRAS